MGKIRKMTNSSTGGPVFVYVQDGKIVRITPIEFDETDATSWEIEARGRKFSSPRKATISPYTAGQKSMIYSDKRNLYPMKRADFDPHGERNCRNRGISGYECIGWDEALDIVSGEINRIKREYGAAAIAYYGSSHQLWGNIGCRSNTANRFKGLIGMTDVEANPDSWEGWHWGAMHTWGFSWRFGMPEQFDLLEDALRNTELIVFWSSDPETTSGIYGAFESTPRRFWLKELGVEMIFIDPFYNHTAGLFSGKWLAPRIGTDNCLALAIAYVWITEGTYDKDYIERRTTGFETWKDYVLGKEDGIPKTPGWAEAESGIPGRNIKALARRWADKKTMLAAGGIGGFGGACRQATGNEWARLMVCLAAMQGCGKPGSNIWSTQQGAPVNCRFYFPGYVMSIPAENPEVNRIAGQPLPHVTRLRLPEAVLDGNAEWHCRGFGLAYIEQQFEKYNYPAPGMPEIQMLYRFGGSAIGTMTETNRYVRMYRSERLPFVVNQSVWFEGETQFADIILPACTNYERWDISEFANSAGPSSATYTQCNNRVITLQKKCIEPLGESRSDYEIFAALSGKLGIRELYTDGGKTELDLVRKMFDSSDIPKYISWEEFYRKGYFVVPPDTEHKSTPSFRWFAEGRDKDTFDSGTPFRNRISKKDLQTSSGKIEFESSSLKRFVTDDPGRPLIPKYIPSWEGHHSELYKKYPLQLVTPHPRFSFHTMGDGKDSFMNDIKDHRVLIDGYYYWIARINSMDAKARGIYENDLINLYNDRGAVICAAQITERVPPGIVHSYGSCAEYDPVGEPGNSPDRGGCVNILSSGRFITKTSSGMACNSCLIEAAKWEGK